MLAIMSIVSTSYVKEAYSLNFLPPIDALDAKIAALRKQADYLNGKNNDTKNITSDSKNDSKNKTDTANNKNTTSTNTNTNTNSNSNTNTNTNTNWMTKDIGYGVKYDGPKVTHGKDGDVEIVSIKVVKGYRFADGSKSFEIGYTVKANSVKHRFEGKPFVRYKLCGYDKDGVIVEDFSPRIITSDNLTKSETFTVPGDTVKIVLEEY